MIAKACVVHGGDFRVRTGGGDGRSGRGGGGGGGRPVRGPNKRHIPVTVRFDEAMERKGYNR